MARSFSNQIGACLGDRLDVPDLHQPICRPAVWGAGFRVYGFGFRVESVG